MIKNSEITLRQVLDTDLQFLMELRNNIDIQKMLLTHPRPNDFTKLNNWIRSKIDDENSELFIIANSESDKPFGFLQIINISFINKYCEMGICIHPEYQGRQIFSKSYKMIETYLINILGLNKILVYIREDNIKSLNAFIKVGFAKVGTLKNHVIYDNNYYNVSILEKIISS